MKELLLGPVLGIENNNSYTLIIVTDHDEDIRIMLQINGNIDYASSKLKKKLLLGFYYRFEINIPPPSTEMQCTYSIVDKINNKFSSKFKTSEWTFSVPGNLENPRIYTCSCNGVTNKRPEEYNTEDLSLWHKMRETHDQYPGHCLIMSGDQVYADWLWEDVPYLNEIKQSLDNIDTAIGHQVSGKNIAKLKNQLALFYEELYINGWGYEDMAYMMASVPSIMMWDDHDIFDGYGSHPKALQDSQIFKFVFESASEYFSLFQIRSEHNKALINLSNNHYTQHIQFRNFEILVLDGRSHRSESQVHSTEQWKDISIVLNSTLFGGIKTDNKFPKTLCLVSSVPMAHFYYPSAVLEMYGWKGRKNFKRAGNDDTLDQWSHPNHEGELKKALDSFISSGRKNKADYVCIVSGDVHSAGVARAFTNEIVLGPSTTKTYHNCISQIIATPIVHPSHSWFQKNILLGFTKSKRKINGYDLRIKNYGQSGKKTIHERNFVVLYKKPNDGFRAYLYSKTFPKINDANHTYMIPKFVTDIDVS